MKIENMKKDIDEFIRELFNGITVFVMTRPIDEKTTEHLNEIFKRLEQYKDRPFVKEFNEEGLYNNIFKYLEGDVDDNFIRKIYRVIIMSRNYGLIMNNTDAIATLKIEKMYAERTSRELEEQNTLLAEELNAYKQFVALQGKTMTGIK